LDKAALLSKKALSTLLIRRMISHINPFLNLN